MNQPRPQFYECDCGARYACDDAMMYCQHSRHGPQRYALPTKPNDAALVDDLAYLIHRQWAHWTEYMLNHLTPESQTRWRRQIRLPYHRLSDREKESDREWARMMLALIERHRQQGGQP